jgi:hypothetical protein
MRTESKHDQITNTILRIRPMALWSLTGDTYEGLEWLDTVQTKPTAEELGL